MTGIKWAIEPTDVEWEMDWSGTKPDGTRLYPDQPLTEMVFEENIALAHLLINEVVMFNQKLFVDCSDVFAWGCADAEDLNGKIEELYRFWQKDPQWGPAVWCMIQRRELPQGPVAKRMTERGWDLGQLANEHGLRPNIYDGLSRLHARRKYDLYCGWRRSLGKEPLPFDGGWWIGWSSYKEAHPDFQEYSGDFHEQSLAARKVWLKENGYKAEE